MYITNIPNHIRKNNPMTYPKASTRRWKGNALPSTSFSYDTL